MGMQARGGRQRLAVGAVVLVAVGIAFASALVARATGEAGPSPIPEGCQLRAPQPGAPLELDVVVVGRLVKTIAMQKEVFDCFDGQSTIAAIKDVETFVEIVGKRTSEKRGFLETTATRIEAATCTKSLRTGRVGCGVAPVQLGATRTPLAGCSPMHGSYPFDPVEQPSDPVEMSTVRFGGGLVDTVKVEKEVFDCGGRIGDLYLFTEIVEAARADTIRPVERRFSGVVCLKDAVRAVVVGCAAFTPARAD